MLCQRAIVTEIAGLFCHIDEALCLPLQGLFHLFMATVGEGVKFLAGVAGIDRVVGTVRVNGEGTRTDVPDVLHVDNATDLPFSYRVAALNNISG